MTATMWSGVYAPLGIIVSRGMLRLVRRPSSLVPLVVMPLFFLIAFTGSFDALGRFDDAYGTNNIVDWMLPWALLQGSAFAGIGAAGFTAEDLEGGFYNRMLMAPVRRQVLLGGLLGYAAVRALIPVSLVIIVGTFLGATYSAGVLGIALLYLGGISMSLMITFLALSVIYRLRTQRSLAIIQVLTFVSLFLSIGQVPIAIMEGWLEYAARINPITNVIRMTRQGMLGDVTWAQTWPGLVAVFSICLVLGTLAVYNLHRLNRS